MNNHGAKGYFTTRMLFCNYYFQVGFDEAKSGCEFRYDFPAENMGGQWQYERGRQFGQIYSGRLLAPTGRVSRRAANAYNNQVKIML